MDIAAARVIASQRRGLLPGLAAAACVLVVAVRQGLMARNPKSLNDEKGEETRRDTLREVEVESTKTEESVGH